MCEREVSWLVWKKLVLVHEHLLFACSGVSVHFKKFLLLQMETLLMLRITPKAEILGQDVLEIHMDIVALVIMEGCIII